MVAGATMGTHQSPQRDKQGKGASTGSYTPLVGPLNEGQVEVNGARCKALIDSGSQVTTVTDVFWRSHPELCKQELRRSSIPIEGAGGQAIPQYGVLYINLKVLGKEFTGVPAFVVPVTKYRSDIPLLVGTNVIRASRSHLEATYGWPFLTVVKEKHPEWYAALLEVGDAELGSQDGWVGPAHYAGRKLYVPAGKEVDVMCKVTGGPRKKTFTAFVESGRLAAARGPCSWPGSCLCEKGPGPRQNNELICTTSADQATCSSGRCIPVLGCVAGE